MTFNSTKSDRKLDKCIKRNHFALSRENPEGGKKTPHVQNDGALTCKSLKSQGTIRFFLARLVDNADRV